MWGGNAEAVVDGETGYVVPPKDPRLLASAILNLANNDLLRSRMAKASEERVKQYFSLQQCVSAYEQCYEAIL